MAYKSVKEILNDVFDSSDSVLKGVYKTEGEVLNMVLDETGDPALKVRIDGLAGDSYTKAQTDSLLSGKSDTGHNHSGTYAAVSHNHDTAYLGLTAKASDSSKLDGRTAEQNGNDCIIYADNNARIKGDFSNALISSRTMFQTCTSNSGSSVGIVPNGTGSYASVALYRHSDPNNTSYAYLGVTSDNTSSLRSLITGSGTYMPMTIHTGGEERIRIETEGSIKIGPPTLPMVFLANQVNKTYSPSFTDTIMYIAKEATTGRSINAAGTINAAGADYAEYMLKAEDCGEIAKGDICGIDSEGRLTDSWANAKHFAVKSTNPSYVGGDTWGTEDIIGIKPANEEELPAWFERLEDARQRVDRVAFCGQVRVNITEFSVGDYIIPSESEGKISAIAVSDPTFEQFLKAVGRVVAREEDGRARIFVRAV